MNGFYHPPPSIHTMHALLKALSKSLPTVPVRMNKCLSGESEGEGEDEGEGKGKAR